MDAAAIRDDAFGMPLTSPAFPRGPYRYTNREHFIITYRTDAKVLKALIPEPLEIDEPLVHCEFMRMEGGTGFDRYSGAAQQIPVRFKGERGVYTHLMFLDVYAPIAGGRELWGFPQKLASPRLSVERDTLFGALDYGPVRVATGTMGYKHRAYDEAAAMRALVQLLDALEEAGLAERKPDPSDRRVHAVSVTKLGFERLERARAAARAAEAAFLAPLSDEECKALVSALSKLYTARLDASCGG